MAAATDRSVRRRDRDAHEALIGMRRETLNGHMSESPNRLDGCPGSSSRPGRRCRPNTARLDRPHVRQTQTSGKVDAPHPPQSPFARRSTGRGVGPARRRRSAHADAPGPRAARRRSSSSRSRTIPRSTCSCRAGLRGRHGGLVADRRRRSRDRRQRPRGLWHERAEHPRRRLGHVAADVRRPQLPHAAVLRQKRRCLQARSRHRPRPLPDAGRREPPAQDRRPAAGGEAWQPTRPVLILANLLALFPNWDGQVAFRFTATGGAVSVDDV